MRTSRRLLLVLLGGVAALAAAVFVPLGTARSTNARNTNARRDRTVAAAYSSCVTSTGIDPGGVQAVISDAGQVTWMKTGVDVPVQVHSGCFRAVGGTGVSLQTSSWGN